MMLIILIILAVVVVDQLTKWWVLSAFTMFESVPLIPGLLYLTRRFNTGAAWSLFEGQLLFFIIITIVAVSLFSVMLWQSLSKNERWQSIGLALLIGGSLGNFIDRVRFGGVIDFIDVYIFSYDFPVFNVADSALTIGVICYMIGVLIDEQRRRQSE
jgi:signal peptidase II